MTQRRRRRRARRGRFGRRAFLAGVGCAALAGAAVMLGRGQTASASSVPTTDEAEPNAALPSGEWRAVWVSYLEWAGMDFFVRRSLPCRCGGADGQLSVHRAEHRHRAGAAFRGRALQEHPLPVEPSLHRRTGAGPRLRPAGRPHHRSTQPGPFAGSVGEPLSPPLLGEDAACTGGK